MLGIGRGRWSWTTYEFVHFLKKSNDNAIIMSHPERSKRAAILGKAEISTFTACREQGARGISTEPKRRGRDMNTPSFSCAKGYFVYVELQRFCLDPTAAPSALWFARLLRCTSQTSVPLRFTQDDTDGCEAQHLTHKQCGCVFVNRGWRTVEDASPYKVGGFPPTTRLFAILCRGDSRIAREAQWPSANNAAIRRFLLREIF